MLNIGETTTMATNKKKTVKKNGTKKNGAARKRRTDPHKGIPSLRGNLRLEFANAALKYESAHAKLQAAVAKRAAMEQNDEFRACFAIIREANSASQDVGRAQAELYEVGRRVAEKLGIEYDEFKNYTIDTDTGRVTYTPVKTDQPQQQQQQQEG